MVQSVQAHVHATGDATETPGCQCLAVHVLSISLVCPFLSSCHLCLTSYLHGLCPRLLLLPPSQLYHWNNIIFKSTIRGTSLEVQWLRLRIPTAGVQVRLLVKKLRFYMPQCVS